MKIEFGTGNIIELTDYELGEFLNEFCYYLKEEGIVGMGKESFEGFNVSSKANKAINKFIEEYKVRR